MPRPAAISTLKRTPISSRFTKQLIDVNDQLCFSALRQHEFEQMLAPILLAHASDFTTSVFPSDPFAKTIYRKIGDLPCFSHESGQIELRMGVIASAEFALAYLEEAQTFRQSLLQTEHDGVKNDAEEEQLRLKLHHWSSGAPVSGFFRTLGYLRLLRNHYAHVNDEPDPAFENYARSHGTPLNKFWAARPTDVHGIDFKSPGFQRLTPDLMFGIMNVLRVSLQHIDAMVADTLSLFDCVRYCVEDVLRSKNGQQLSVARVTSKVRMRLRMDWNIEASAADLLPLVEQAITQATTH